MRRHCRRRATRIVGHVVQGLRALTESCLGAGNRMSSGVQRAVEIEQKVRRTEYEARSLIFSGQLGHPFFSIRVTLEVSSCSVEEPLQSVFDTTS